MRSVLKGHDPQLADLLIYGVPGEDEGSDDGREEELEYENDD